MTSTNGVRRSVFDSAYAEGVPPWNIGRPQPEFMRLAEEGEITGSVLDVGCGTGALAIYLAERRHDVCGIDAVPAAIARAKTAAAKRGVAARFVVGDALHLENIGGTFDTVVDSGLFHVFSDHDRLLFAESLARALRAGGKYLMLCFSERETSKEGPRRVTRDEIRSAFRDGWTINYIREARFQSNIHAGGALAWLASITRDQEQEVQE